jgi:cytochrome bd ubiquinol oxidase subunit I
MDDHVLIDRLQFTLTVTFHYLFPILTMGLALFIAHMKTVSYLGRPDRRLSLYRKTDVERERYEGMSRFWAKIFAVNFAFGVVTGIPLEFQFGTNWAAFSNYSGGVIGQTLAMEGVFAFFAESVFLGVFLAGRGRVGERLHWLSAVMVSATFSGDRALLVAYQHRPRRRLLHARLPPLRAAARPAAGRRARGG